MPSLNSPVLSLLETHSPLRILVCGYVGFDNLGDELIAATLIQQLSAVAEHVDRPMTVTVLTQQPQATKEFLTPYASSLLTIETLYRKNALQVVAALTNAQVFICGGGGLLQDATGLASPIYYGGLMQLAKWLGCRVLAWGHGLGPLETKLGQTLTAQGLRACQSIVVRDDASARWVRQFAQREPRQTTDTVWGLQPLKPYELDKERPTTTRIGLSLRPFAGWAKADVGALLTELLKGFPPNSELALLPAQPNQDELYLVEIGAAIKAALPQWHITVVPAAQVAAMIPTCSAMIAMRYHVTLLAALANVPTIGLVYSSKVQALCESVGFGFLNSPMQRPLPGFHTPDKSAIARHQQQASNNRDALLGILSGL